MGENRKSIDKEVHFGKDKQNVERNLRRPF